MGDLAPNLVQLPLRLPREDYEGLRNLAYFSRRSMNAIVVEMLHQFLVGEGRDLQLEAAMERCNERYGQPGGLFDRLIEAGD